MVGKLVGICGEFVGDSGGVLLLMVMGYDLLFMNVVSLFKVKLVICSVSCEWVM